LRRVIQRRRAQRPSQLLAKIAVISVNAPDHGPKDFDRLDCDIENHET
jgi:hypothetical protein